MVGCAFQSRRKSSTAPLLQVPSAFGDTRSFHGFGQNPCLSLHLPVKAQFVVVALVDVCVCNYFLVYHILFTWLLKPLPTSLIPTSDRIQRVVDFNELRVVDFNGLG